MLADTFQKTVPRRSPSEQYAIGLRRKTYVLFMIAAALVLGAGAYAIGQAGSQISQDRLFNELTAALTAEESRRVDTTAISQSFRTMQTHLMIATMVVLAVMWCLALVFIEKVVKPIEHIGAAADKIAKGQLNALDAIHSTGEVGQITALIHDMAMNLQEVLLLVWNHTGRNRQRLELMTDMLRHYSDGDALPDKFMERFNRLSRDVEELQRFIEAFDFYDVRLTYGKALAAGDGETLVPS